MQYDALQNSIRERMVMDASALSGPASETMRAKLRASRFLGEFQRGVSLFRTRSYRKVALARMITENGETVFFGSVLGGLLGTWRTSDGTNVSYGDGGPDPEYDLDQPARFDA